MKVRFYFLICYLIEQCDFVCQPHNSHQTLKKILKNAITHTHTHAHTFTCTYIVISFVLGSAYGVIIIIIGNGHTELSSNPGLTVCSSHSASILGKDMNPIILPPALGKLFGRLGSLTFIWQPVLEKKNSEFKYLKTDFVSYFAHDRRIR